jgi:hypothetical protein
MTHFPFERSWATSKGSAFVHLLPNYNANSLGKKYLRWSDYNSTG